MFGNFFNRWPYSDLQNLNLDWIIRQVKENKIDIENFRSELEEMGVDIEEFRQYIDNIDSEIQQKINVQVPIYVQQSINNGLLGQLVTASHKRRVVVIGDSYGAGWTPDGNVTGFPSVIKTLLGLSDADFFTENKGGARFGADLGSEYAFDTVLANLIPNITNKQSITDIIFAGGYNETASSYAQINNGISRCKTLIANNFSNPSLKVYLFSIGYHASNPDQREKLWQRYRTSYAKSGWGYTHLTPAIFDQTWWASDGYHPLQNAQNAIAQNIVSIMNGGTEISHPNMQSYAQTSQSGMVFYEAFYNDFMECFIFGQNIAFSNPVTLSRSTAVKVLDITSNYPIANTTDVSLLQKQGYNCIVKDSNNVYHQGVVVLHIQQENRTTYGLYASIFMTNDAGTDYETITANELQLCPSGTRMIIPYKC